MTIFERIILFPLMIGAIYLNFRSNFTLNTDFIIELVLGSLFSLLCFAIHRFIQSYYANKAGDINQKVEGYLTLNPFKFIDWLGILPFVFFNFGWANPIKSDKALKGELISQRLLILLSGVILNLTIGIISTLLIGPIENISLTLSAILRLFARVNIYYALFSLLPLPPLDGWLIILAILRKNANIHKYEFYGELLIIVLIGSEILPKLISYLGSYIFSFFYL